jgi:FAD/FMN-containing dehydrogenase
MWHLRESIPLAEAEQGKGVKHDVSIPISSIAGFVHKTNALLQQRFPNVRNVVFGHLGDGNLHLVVTLPHADLERFKPRIEALVYAELRARGGSVSAEHGIGLEKKPWLSITRSPQERALMGAIKRALDPAGILNPGKLLDGGAP